ncbi:hypothetical protein RRG08_016205 [Elysia crispata]|uniref:Uncharacterized protein n=1 Tax=Elysia crispata TaxID=231223 RepID=A0AAE1DJN3_9GAST|nr:hypothetical protein RRG08_016205 [Elysia crispata]
MSHHAKGQINLVFTSLALFLCTLGVAEGGIVHHDPGDIQSSYNLFNLLNNYVTPQQTSATVTQMQIVTECPPNVIFVLDGSGSISFKGFETAKLAVIREIRALTKSFAQVDVGVVLFSEKNIVIPLETRSPAQIEEMIQEIMSLTHPRLGTELNEAIRAARRALAVHSTIATRALNGDKSGNILVLFTDGQVEPNVERASALEVQTAQSKGILVLIDTVEEPSKTVQNIAPTVLESRTPINWVDFVACPPATLNPPPKGSGCRDFYMVVDGSDTVLRYEGTIRQYLAYTALRYRKVKNSIGINIFGTDANVQARNTRIRLTENKYQLADDIRQELRFPRSRGAGTSHAITQSIGFLNDDIRDRPAALVLIMNGPPLDLMATAQAIRQARQQGYPVAIIRIGKVTNGDLNTLASGDMRGVYNIEFVTDLFGVNFDTFLCEGAPTCQLTPQSCIRPRIFHQSSCSCVCGNTCRVGTTHNANCECECEGTCPAGQAHDSNCLCRCANPCPQGTRRSSGCTCTACPYLCENNQFQDPKCACHCRNTCPEGYYKSNQCRCLCVRPLSNGTCPIIKSSCPSSAIQVGNSSCRCNDFNKRYDELDNQCVACPPNSQLVGNTNCQCNDPLFLYNSASNTCVCRSLCPPGLVQNPSTCACSCTTQCPSNQYNNPGTNCICLCRSTNQPPQGGVCLTCPPNSQVVGNTCQCNNPLFSYNPSSNACVCRSSCPTGSVQNPSTCTCSCALQCPSNQYNNPQTNCRCLCRSTNQPPQGGVCLTCPSNSQVVGNTCECTDPLFSYNPTSNTCVCRSSCPTGSVQNPSTCSCSCTTTCPSNQYNNPGTNCRCLCTSTNQPPQGGVCFVCPPNSQVVGNTCQCTDPLFSYNPTSNTCVCRSSCPTGSVQNPSTCTCSCALQCPSNQYNNPGTNCRCLCTSTNQPPQGGVCLTCPPNSQVVGNTCQCTDPLFSYNPTSSTCVCRSQCPTGSVQNPSTCACSCATQCPPNQYNNLQTNCRCLCTSTNQPPQGGVCFVCPPNSQIVGNTCQCTDPLFSYNPTSNTCGCRSSCPTGSVQNPSTCACSCATQCPSNQYNNLQTNCRCLCTSTNQPPQGGVCFVCPPNSQVVGNTCQCTDPLFSYNPASNTCVCRNACPTGSVQNPSTCTCSCATQCPSNQYNNPGTNCRCLCTSTNQPPQGGVCVSCPPNSQLVGNTCQCTDPLFSYNPTSNTCGELIESVIDLQRFVKDTANLIQFYLKNICPPFTKFCSMIFHIQFVAVHAQLDQSRTPQHALVPALHNVLQTSTTTQEPTVDVFVHPQTNHLKVAFVIVGNTCQCTDPLFSYNPTSNTCVCRSACPTGSVQNPSTCTCSCATQCPSNQYNNPETNCRCLCTSTNQPPQGGVCFVCPPNSQVVGNTCQCTDPLFSYNPTSNTCACRSSCPTGSVQNPSTCTCSCATQCPSNQYNNQQTNCRCLCRSTNQPPQRGVCLTCPPNSQVVGNTCQCTDPLFLYNPTSNTCVCRGVCPTGSVQDPSTCACSCRVTCPANQYNNPGTNCRCLCTSTNQPPLSGVCLNCPPNSEAVGATCRCIDRCFTYNPTTNSCVQNCPNDATLVGNTCQCKDTKKRYDASINRCVTSVTCPTNSRAVGTSCQCIDPSFIYNANTNTCVGNRQGEVCNIKPSDCQPPQVFKANQPCRCEIPEREQCSASEWSCANGRPAYRDCHGACVCECSSQFAGPRCEITVNASLCDHCHYIQGIYKAGIPGFCDMFVHCDPVLSAGTDVRGRPRAFTATIQQCAPGTYYVTRPDGYGGCDWLSAGSCYGDKCAELPPSSRFPDESACQRYWECGANRRLAKRGCCPAGQGFDPRTQQCVANPSCPDVCGPCNTTGTEPQCPLAPVVGRPNQYYYLTRPGTILPCPASLIFDPTICTCVTGQRVDSGPQLCIPTFQTGFERPLQYENKVPIVTFQGQQVGQFDGSGDLVIKAFAQSGFHTNHFQIDLRVNLATASPINNGQRVAVVTNADCQTIESVSITMDATNFYFRIYQMESTIPAEIAIPYAGLQDPNGWYQVSLVYSGRPGNFQFTATVGSRREIYRGPVPLINYIDRRKCALHIGFGYKYLGYQGYLDDISLWRCKP